MLLCDSSWSREFCACHLLLGGYVLVLLFSLKMEVVHSSELLLVNSYRTARCHILEGSNLHSDCCENLKHFIIVIATLWVQSLCGLNETL